MQKVHDEQHVNISDKDRMEHSVALTLPWTRVLTQPLENGLLLELPLLETAYIPKLNFFCCLRCTKWLLLNKVKE